MNGFLSQNVLITRISNSSAAAQTAVTSSVLDMAGYDGVLFLAALGDVTSGSILTLTANENTANSTSSPTPTAITGGASSGATAGATNYDSKIIAVDVYRPTKRYVYVVLTRTTQDAVVDGIFAVQYRGRSVPETNSGMIEMIRTAVN